jgi:hypothetical protein
LGLLSSIFAFGAIAMTSEFANSQNVPAKSPRRERVRILAPLLVPEGATEYEPVPPETIIKGRHGVKAAQLVNPPPELAKEIAIWKLDSIPKDRNGKPMPPDPEMAPEAVAYEMISSTRYTGNGHVIYVTTARMGPAALKVKHTLGTTAKLADGTEVGVAVACKKPSGEVSQTSDGVTQYESLEQKYDCVEGSSTPNQVVFTKGNLIVTVASDLPIEQVMDLATKVVIK